MTTNPLFQRLQLVTGTPALDHLGASSAAVFGIGGVGSWTAEALVRSGLGAITLVDNDVICITNVNRQLQATTKNVGKPKVEELAARLRLLNPRCEVTPVMRACEPATVDTFNVGQYTYVLDCIDSITCKVALIRAAHAAGCTLFSAMGAAAKLDPTQVRVTSIWESTGCPLAKWIRRRLRESGFQGDFPVVWSPEFIEPVETTSVACGTHTCYCPKFVPADEAEHRDWCSEKKVINGTAVHMTAIFGMMLAGLVVQDAVARSASARPTAATGAANGGSSAQDRAGPAPATGSAFPLADER
ncbi:MAG: tRNA threonylcarbamoyladenosine dehydratase [bacterium]|jgi:tRNA A37 threonylcarbamoyladenosine dehydratase|nr:tRNA threonylcarbamoyladenosine dehydratase [bacterium]MBK9774880.1 tRNA threonylcarbamoyladenosine dehydratase [bacterium]